MAVKSFSVSVLSRVQSGKHQDLYPFSSLAMQVSSQLLAFGIHISQLRMLSNLQVPSAMLPEPWGQFSITLFSCSGSKSARFDLPLSLYQQCVSAPLPWHGLLLLLASF